MILAPLDWGLGHATRCIPLVRALAAAGFEVLVAAEGAQAHLLRKEFPGITILPLEGYHVRYSRWKWLLPLKILAQLPRLQRLIKTEQKWLDTAIQTHRPALVISDNRYGFWSGKVPCIFITHQLTVKAPFHWVEQTIQRALYRYINRFTVCWVPDVKGEDNLAGILSHPHLLPQTPIRYIGLLSRFEERPVNRKYDYCVLLSGPEPQRSLLEEKMLALLQAVNGKILLVRGKPGSGELIDVAPHIEVSNHLPGDALEAAILQSEYIVCRSGYTTLMEILSLRKKAILIPTPGQTEQEYLAHKLHRQQVCMRIAQDRLTAAALLQSRGFPFHSKQFHRFTGLDDLLNDL